MEFSPIRLNLVSHDTFGIKIQEFLALFDFDSKSSGPMTFYRIKHENKPIIEISTLPLDNRLEIKLALLDSNFGNIAAYFFKWLDSTYDLGLDWTTYYAEIFTQKIMESDSDPAIVEFAKAGLGIEIDPDKPKRGRPPISEDDIALWEETVNQVLTESHEKNIAQKIVCENMGLSYPTFRYWKNRLKK